MKAILRKISTLITPAWIKIAEGELGQKEVKGGENPRILEYHSTTTLRASEDEISWCSSFVNWVMKESGYERTNSAAARSWLKVGRELKYFQKYSIVILKRGNVDWQGHVGFAMDQDDGKILVLGGNQDNSVCLKYYKEEDVLGYRWPEEDKGVSQKWT